MGGTLSIFVPQKWDVCQGKKALRSDANCCIHVLLCIVAQRELLISVECIPKRGATSADANIYLYCVHDNKQIDISVSC